MCKTHVVCEKSFFKDVKKDNYVKPLRTWIVQMKKIKE